MFLWDRIFRRDNEAVAIEQALDTVKRLPVDEAPVDHDDTKVKSRKGDREIQ